VQIVCPGCGETVELRVFVRVRINPDTSAIIDVMPFFECPICGYEEEIFDREYEIEEE